LARIFSVIVIPGIAKLLLGQPYKYIRMGLCRHLGRFWACHLSGKPGWDTPAQRRKAAACRCGEIPFEIYKIRTTHTGVGAEYPKKLHPSPGAPAAFASPLATAQQKRVTDPGSLGGAWPMLRVPASEKKHAPLYWVGRLKVLL
jgi:hypothetical protein